MARTLIAVAIVSAMVAVAVESRPVLAAPAETDTITVHGVTESSADVNPCTGDPATVTVTYNAVLHTTVLPTGDLLITSTLTGTFVIDPLDPDLPSYVGHFVDFSNQIYNRNEDLATFTTRATGTGTDGSRLRFGVIAHVTADTVDVSTDPPTTTGLKVIFLKFSCV